MRFLEKTLRDIMRLIRETVADDAIAARPGFLQGADPRFKLAAIMAVIASSVVAREPGPLVFLWLLAFLAARASRIGARFFLARTVLFIPLFTAFIAIPAIFSAVTPGDEIAAYSIGSLRLAITRQGLLSGALLTLRSLDAVSFSVLLVLTTGRTALLASLRAFRVPSVFVMTTGMTLRYVYLLLDCAERSFLAVKSRVGIVEKGADGRRTVGWGAGALWLSSYRLQGAVYDAMVSRGFSGEYVQLEGFRARARDVVLLAFSVLILAGVIWLNRYSR